MNIELIRRRRELLRSLAGTATPPTPSPLLLSDTFIIGSTNSIMTDEKVM